MEKYSSVTHPLLRALLHSPQKDQAGLVNQLHDVTLTAEERLLFQQFLHANPGNRFHNPAFYKQCLREWKERQSEVKS